MAGSEPYASTLMSPAPTKLKKVSVRLFAADVTALKKAARADGLPWQTRLRLLVHRALGRKEEIR